MKKDWESNWLGPPVRSIHYFPTPRDFVVFISTVLLVGVVLISIYAFLKSLIFMPLILIGAFILMAIYMKIAKWCGKYKEKGEIK